jgi:membrane fusion protein (multidrug efflux system)
VEDGGIVIKLEKPMFIMLGSVGILFVLIFAYKAFGNYMIKKYMSQKPPPVSVSAMKASYEPWQPKMKTSGSLRAVKGVDVTTEIAGLVRNIHFTPGQNVKNQEILVELNADSETAQLKSLQATSELAEAVYERDKAQFAIKAISKATLDADAADLKSKLAKVAEQAAIVDKKTIRAPFEGRLGISYVNPGQYMTPGNPVVTLQALDPIYVDFYLPQQALVQVGVGQTIKMTVDTYPDRIFTGKITTINPKIDPATRNVQVEAALANPDFVLLPGMFSSIELETGASQPYITLPQTAISFNPYGEIVYILKENTHPVKDKNNTNSKLRSTTFTATQIFVTVGETRGNQVSVLKGINKNDYIVTAGQHKLKNGSEVIINNSILPSNDPAPKLANEQDKS